MIAGSTHKKILLICNYFAPDNTIAAVRTSKIAKYLKQNGYEVQVIAEKNTVMEDEILKKDAEGIRVCYAYQSKFYQMFYKKYQEIIQPYKKKRFDNLDNRYRRNSKTGNMEFYPFETAYPFLGSLDYIMGLMKQYDLFLSIKKILRQCKNFDYVITSYGDIFSLFAGQYYHKYHKGTPWIFDIRDAVYRYKFTPCYVSWIAKLYERQIWRGADCILGVSKGICRKAPLKYRKKVHCLTNGYDMPDRDNLSTGRLDQNKLVFTYTGSMYGGIRDLSVLFKAVREAINKGAIDEEGIAFHYAGNDPAYEIFKGQAQKYELGKNCATHGKLSHRDTLELQQQSDVLLVASYDYQNNQGGVITGKALEYMSAGKPIVAIMMGDIQQSELANIIRNTKTGIAYEDAHKEEDYGKLYDYLCKL
ncbi:MAG: glycosyltransferase, partial [Lachnospiraceae bacterium]|nr:glycosyltransferase [Lachnospiraceae bacterium]